MAMSRVPLARTTWKRDYAGSVALPLLNRFFEADPTSTEDDTALLARPGTDFYRAFGDGPFREIFTQPGFFDDDMFVASGRALIGWDGTTETAITGTLSDSTSPVSITYQASPGVERLWLADGENLYYYEGLSKASGTLNATAQVTAGDQVRLGAMYYEFVASDVDTGSPAGTSANPWKVLIGLTLSGSLQNLGAAIDASGTPGGTYSTALTANVEAQTRRIQPERIIVQAITAGAGGNSIVTTETSSVLSWGSGTLANGGTHSLVAVAVPEGGSEAPVSVTTLAGYVIITVAGSQRMYFIRPSEFWVEIFAEAESEPDEVLQAITVGDEFWALGRSTIEPWSPTGDPDIPFAPVIGRAMKFGFIPGTARVIEDQVYFCDDKGIARKSTGQRISNHSIEEQLRLRG